MLGRRRTKAPASTDTADRADPDYYDDDDDVVGSDGAWNDGGADTEAGDDDGEWDEDGETDDVEAAWDEDADDWDEGDGEEEDGVEDEWDEDADDDAPGSGQTADAAAVPFRPPTFLQAARQAFLPNRQSAASTSTAADGGGTQAAATSTARRRAQPATGTEEDARAVNLIDRRERMIGFVLGFGLVALSALAYNSDHRYTNKDLAKQLAVRHAAVEVLLIFAVLGVATLGATLFKRRALLGFILTFGGLALLQTLGIFGLIYLGSGGWLIFRAMKRSPRSRARQSALDAKSNGRAGARSSGAGGPRTSTSTRASSGTAAAGTSSGGTSSNQRQIGRNNRAADRPGTSRVSTTTSGRYTPPKQNRRPPPPKQPDPPEPSNRLTAWLRK